MIVPQDIYLPLYEDTEHPIILITGGRGSGKSYNTGAFIERLSFEQGHVILYTRYTMTSASISVIPEFQEKIIADGTEEFFDITKTDIENTVSGSKILFRGIKTSSGNQTAKLKSIQGITTFVCDEAEEWTSEEDFDKMRLSIRQKGIQNRVIIIMNPTDSNHFVYRKYIEKTHKVVNIDGVDVQISTHPNVLHIHSTYLDNVENLSEAFISDVQMMKEENPDKYAHIVMGRWADIAEGAIFKNIHIIKEFPDDCEKLALCQDFGYTNDPTAIAKCGIKGNALYIDEICYKTHMLTKEIIEVLKKYPRMKVISESADPRLIDEIHNAGILIYPVDKSGKSIIAGIEKMLEMEIYVTERSYNMLSEFRNYVWDKDKDGRPINRPADGQMDHLCDAVRYYVLGMLLGKIIKPKKIPENINIW
jgi:phage terminase large subunit